MEDLSSKPDGSNKAVTVAMACIAFVFLAFVVFMLGLLAYATFSVVVG